jgi:hypothetical protein
VQGKGKEPERKTQGVSFRDWLLVFAPDLSTGSRGRSLQGAAVSHMSRIPVEIFVRIMSYIDTNSRLRASLVCRWWRQAIVGSPVLWQDLYLSFNEIRSLQSKTRLWLARSAGALKSLHFKIDDDVGTLKSLNASQSTVYRRLLDKMINADEGKVLRSLESLSHTNVWVCTDDLFVVQFTIRAQNLRYLHFTGPMASLDTLLSHLPALRVLKGGGGGRYWGSERECVSPLDGVESHPLQSLSLFTPDMDHRGAPCPIQLRGLVDLDLASVPALVHPLRRGQLSWPSLRSLTLRSTYELPPLYDDGPWPKLDMPCLARLRCEWMRDETRQLLRQINMPELEEVEFERPLRFDREDIEFLAASFPKLIRLSLPRAPIDEDALLSLLPSWPRLLWLNLSHTSVTNRLIDALPHATPSLERLNVSGCEALTGGPLIRLVKARYDVQAKRGGIRELSMRDCKGVEPEAVAWLKQAVKLVTYRYQDPKEAARRWMPAQY